MKVLVVGGGGREHALVWKIAQSPQVETIYCAPGNAGIADLATCLPIEPEDLDGLLQFARQQAIDLTIAGPEGPLSLGIVDRFEAAGLRIFGASQRAAEIESSKSFAKNLMFKYGIPTAAGQSFDNYEAARIWIEQANPPLVVKADGLAAGKGVIVCATRAAAQAALQQIMLEKAFGAAGDKVLIEDCLTGEEASFLAFTDGKTLLPLPTSQDHKPVFDKDEGPNTGGMGAYSPAPVVDALLHRQIMQKIMQPTVDAMAAEGRPYRGVLYAGLMIERDQIRVLEFNARFGDPEAQPLLMRIQSDIIPIMEAVIDGRLHTCQLKIDARAAICVVMASGGYPGSYAKGLPIKGLNQTARLPDTMVFHAGTQLHEGQFCTAGGRVLGVTALGRSIKEAISGAYNAAAHIQWDQVHYRQDIGQKALTRLDALPEVGIVMGSDSDLSVMEEAALVLKKFGIRFELTVASAHRTPARAMAFASQAVRRGLKVIIAGAGHAAHLAGVLAAHTPLPVIGVPIDSSCLQGLDALLATVQMPPGVPVATMAVGKSGARNAGILAAQIIALGNPEVALLLNEFKAEMAEGVARKASKIEYRG